ncbi:hypothetical protein [Oscillibacter sp.]|uniref:hypothetical protein n=1 Tax=Oscillibacter sp. TaxID=1945593 RepID=UPI002612055C|nr:hypothetical protein [Oscillibacter sp.]MDD3346241.1 hypothetical protein [Oscillibacter sp.]
MDGPVFDALLKTALEEAALADLGELEGVPEGRSSVRQRRRMRRMLADPHRYARCWAARESAETPRRRGRISSRWLMAAVIAALLAGTAAGYTLRGGDFLRQMFDKSPWTAEYGSAADTEQLLDMGGGNVGTVLEDAHFRFELLDAVSEGENAMAAVRITVLDTEPLEKAFGSHAVAPALFLRQDGSFFRSGSSGIEYIYPDQDPDLAENQFLLIFRSDGNHSAREKKYTISFHDFGYCRYEDQDDAEGEEIVLVPGDWTLEMKLKFDGGRVVKKDETIQMEDCTFTVNEVRVSALSVGMIVHSTFENLDAVSDALMDARFEMKDGTQVPFTGFRLSGMGEDADGFASEILYEFGMPLEKDQLSALLFRGQEISLTK